MDLPNIALMRSIYGFVSKFKDRDRYCWAPVCSTRIKMDSILFLLNTLSHGVQNPLLESDVAIVPCFLLSGKPYICQVLELQAKRNVISCQVFDGGG